MQKPQVEDLIAFFRSQRIKSVADLRSRVREAQFRNDFMQALADTAKRNGSTLTLGAIATWISMAIGSIGLAGLGTAIGVPVSVLVFPVALFAGGFIDKDGFLARMRNKLGAIFGSENLDNAGDAFTRQAIELLSERIDDIAKEVEDLRSANREMQAAAASARKLIWVALLLGAAGVCLGTYACVAHSLLH